MPETYKFDPIQKILENPLNEKVQQIKKHMLYASGIILIFGLSGTLPIPGTKNIILIDRYAYLIIIGIVLYILYLSWEVFNQSRSSVNLWRHSHENEYSLFVMHSYDNYQQLREFGDIDYHAKSEEIRGYLKDYNQLKQLKEELELQKKDANTEEEIKTINGKFDEINEELKELLDKLKENHVSEKNIEAVSDKLIEEMTFNFFNKGFLKVVSDYVINFRKKASFLNKVD